MAVPAVKAFPGSLLPIPVVYKGAPEARHDSGLGP